MSNFIYQLGWQPPVWSEISLKTGQKCQYIPIIPALERRPLSLRPAWSKEQVLGHTKLTQRNPVSKQQQLKSNQIKPTLPPAVCPPQSWRDLIPEKHTLLFQRAQVWFPALTPSSSRGSMPSGLLRYLCLHLHTCTQTQTQKQLQNERCFRGRICLFPSAYINTHSSIKFLPSPFLKINIQYSGFHYDIFIHAYTHVYFLVPLLVPFSLSFSSILMSHTRMQYAYIHTCIHVCVHT